MTPMELYPVLLQAIIQMEEKGLRHDPRYGQMVNMADRVKSQMYPQQPSQPARYAYPQSFNQSTSPYTASPHNNTSPASESPHQGQMYQNTFYPQDGDSSHSSGAYQNTYERNPSEGFVENQARRPSPGLNNGMSNNNAYGGYAPPAPYASFSPGPIGSNGYAEYPGMHNPPSQSPNWQQQQKMQNGSAGLTPIQKQILETHVAAYRHFSRREFLPEALYNAILHRRPLQRQTTQTCGKKVRKSSKDFRAVIITIHFFLNQISSIN